MAVTPPTSAATPAQANHRGGSIRSLSHEAGQDEKQLFVQVTGGRPQVAVGHRHSSAATNGSQRFSPSRGRVPALLRDSAHE